MQTLVNTGDETVQYRAYAEYRTGKNVRCSDQLKLERYVGSSIGATTR